MGMYTEFHFNVELKENVPSDVVDVLNYMLSNAVFECPSLPNHPLFETDRWIYMLNMESYYFPFKAHSTLDFDPNIKRYLLAVKCSLKNYDDEIEKFVNWIDPYVDAEPGQFLGFSRYEESENPILIYKK